MMRCIDTIRACLEDIKAELDSNKSELVQLKIETNIDHKNGLTHLIFWVVFSLPNNQEQGFCWWNPLFNKDCSYDLCYDTLKNRVKQCYLHYCDLHGLDDSKSNLHAFLNSITVATLDLTTS